MKLRLSLLTLLALVSTESVLASESKRWYVTGDLGLGVLGSEEQRYTAPGVDETATADFDASFAGGATFGYHLNENWRLEGELMYRRNDLSEISLPSLGTFSEGDFASLSVGASALRDFNLFGSDKVKSYAGAGIVFLQEIDIDYEAGGVETSFETDDIGFQLQFGARYDLTDRLFLNAGLRYLIASGIEMELPADPSQVIESDYSPLTATLGVGFRF